MNQEGLLSKNSLLSHLLEDAFATPDPTGLSWGYGDSKQNQERHGMDLPCAAYKADEPEMDGSTNTPKMQSPSLLQASTGPMSLPTLESSILHQGSLPGLHLLAGGELGSPGLCHCSPPAHLKVQEKGNSDEKGGRGITS